VTTDIKYMLIETTKGRSHYHYQTSKIGLHPTNVGPKRTVLIVKVHDFRTVCRRQRQKLKSARYMRWFKIRQGYYGQSLRTNKTLCGVHGHV